MLFFLHKGIVESIVEEGINNLQLRGNSHRAILEKHFDEETINHVILMESESTTDVVITDQKHRVLASTSENHATLMERKPTIVPLRGQVVEDGWESEPFISTVSPVMTEGETVGYVYMFQPTDSVHALIHRLNEHFILAGLIAIVLTLIVIFFLSNWLTNPLIKMKEATSQISQGHFSVSLPKTSDDELGDLAKSIKDLAIHLDHLTNERSEFLASISHELRTPLTYMKGYADIINKRDLPSDEKRKYLKIILEETNRLTDLITDLFDLAKMDQNEFIIKKEWIPLKDFFANMQAKWTPSFQEKNIALHVSCDANILLSADPLRLEQIFLNLLDNSLKYCKEGGNVSLTAYKDGGNVIIHLRDDGTGIPDQDLPFIFNRFYRVDKSRSRSRGGTGLGLAIVKQLMKAHHAEISAQSEEKNGTEFQLTFKGEDNKW